MLLVRTKFRQTSVCFVYKIRDAEVFAAIPKELEAKSPKVDFTYTYVYLSFYFQWEFISVSYAYSHAFVTWSKLVRQRVKHQVNRGYAPDGDNPISRVNNAPGISEENKMQSLF